MAKTILPLNMTGKVFNKVDNMRATLIALLMTIASQAGAGCGNLRDNSWWETAAEADLQAELDGGADVTAQSLDGGIPLHWAAQAGYLANIQALLDAGADVMARDEIGRTPLHSAALEGSPANIQSLLAAGADVMARDRDGWTPLHRAAPGTPANIQALLVAGADVMARNKYSWTPLHSAADCVYSCKPGVIQALLDAGADAKAKNKEGKTPWDYTQNNEKLEGTKGYWALNDAQYR